MRVLSSSSPLKASLTGTGTTRAGPGGGNGHGFRKASGAADATRLASRRRRAKRTSGTGTRCLPRCILILIVLAKSTWGAFATTSCDMSWWPDKDHGKECGNCKVLVDQFKSKYKTCSGYCDTVGRSCVGAWEESGDTCTVKYVMTCSQQLSSSDAICECGAPTSSGSSTRCDTVIPGLPVSTSTIDKNTCNRGVLPASIGALTNLKVLDMSDQKFYGKIPIEIGKLTKLEKLAVDGTGVSGTIPPLGALTNLKVLDMSDQKISGKIPVEIGKLTKLEELSDLDRYFRETEQMGHDWRLSDRQTGKRGPTDIASQIGPCPTIAMCHQYQIPITNTRERILQLLQNMLPWYPSLMRKTLAPTKSPMRTTARTAAFIP